MREGQQHIPKEGMVIAYIANSVNANGHIALALPTCSKSEKEYQENIQKLCCDSAETSGAFVSYDCF